MPTTQESMERHWLPFTDNRSFKREPRLFVRASGMHYWNDRGEKILDGSSGLFTSAAGHCRPEIAKAVGEQLQTLDFTPSFMRGHPLSFDLANAVAGLTPPGLDHIFFCNSGSESVDTAIKIAFAYHLARKEGQRSFLVSRERAYHGVNIGGTALSGMVRNREAFGTLLPGVLHLRHTLLPANRLTRGMGETGGMELADDLLRFVQLVGEKRIAAVFVEPIAGSTGVIVPPRGYLERIREICDRYGILLVFDEVICGFGRTGKAVGGDGNDTYWVASQSIKIVEAGGIDSQDVVKSTVSYKLGGGLEQLTLLGQSDINGTGNGLANTLRGNAGDNILIGNAGSDILIGGRGDDILTGGKDGDTFVFARGTGHDTVTDYVGNTDRIDFSGMDGITGFADMKSNHLSTVNGNVIITDGADQITLLGVDKAELVKAMFDF